MISNDFQSKMKRKRRKISSKNTGNGRRRGRGRTLNGTLKTYGTLNNGILKMYGEFTCTAKRGTCTAKGVGGHVHVPLGLMFPGSANNSVMGDVMTGTASYVPDGHNKSPRSHLCSFPAPLLCNNRYLFH